MAATDTVVRWTVPAERAELAAEELWDRGATAVALGEGSAGLRGDGAGTTTLTASYPTDAAARLVAGELGADAVELSRDWARGWRPYAEPVDAGGLVVAPAWRDVDLPGRTVLRIDPGDCFGSGSHPSSRLILTALAADPPVGLAVADVGTGSGILAVAAAVLGAARVEAVDIDPAAAGIVEANAARNGVAHLVTAGTGSEVGSGHDLVLVNVTAAVQVELAPMVAGAVRPGGRVLLAGLLPGQWRHVAGAYPGFDVVATPELDGWVGADLRRRV